MSTVLIVIGVVVGGAVLLAAAGAVMAILTDAWSR